MGQPQKDFLEEFKMSFDEKRFGKVKWIGGQRADNTAKLCCCRPPRRSDSSQKGNRESFELGDLRANVGGHMVIVEFESEGVAVQNIVKYWPFVRGELSVKPESPVLLCHFSNWESYGSYRALWKWLSCKMAEDPELTVRFRGKQFDHGGKKNLNLRSKSISDAIDWLAQIIINNRPGI